MLPSLKGLILSKVGNGQAQRIHWNQGVGNGVHDRKYKMSDVAFPPRHHVIRRGVVYLFKIHAGSVRLAPEIFNRNITHVDLNLITPASKEGFNRFVSLVFCDDACGQSPVQIVERPHVVLPHGRALPTVVALDKVHQEVADLGFVRLVSEAAIANRLSATDFINADDQGFEMVERLVHAYIHKKQNDGNDRQAKYADFQVKIADQNVAELFHVMTSGLGEFLLGQPRKLAGAHEILPLLVYSFCRQGTADSPERQANSEFTSDGIKSTPHVNAISKKSNGRKRTARVAPS